MSPVCGEPHECSQRNLVPRQVVSLSPTVNPNASNFLVGDFDAEIRSWRPRHALAYRHSCEEEEEEGLQVAGTKGKLTRTLKVWK